MNDPEDTSTTVETETRALTSPTSKPCNLSSTETLSLGQRKGPLPPIPSYAQTASDDPASIADMEDFPINPYLLPPPYPAPKLVK